MKKITILILTLLLTLALAAPATAVDTAPLAPDVRVNGALVTFPDTKPFVDENSRTLIPVRFVGEALGAEVSWENATQTAVIAKDGITVRCQIGNDELTVIKDGKTSTVKMDTKAVIKDGRTTVPIRYVAEALGSYVSFSDLYNTVQITNGGVDEANIARIEQIHNCKITDNELTAADIERLQAYYDMDTVEGKKAGGSYDQDISLGYKLNRNEKLLKKYGNEYIFEDAVEEYYRSGKFIINSFMGQINVYEGHRYTLGEVSTEEYAKAMYEATLDAAYSLGIARVEVTFKTNANLIFKSKYMDSTTIRGIMTVVVPESFSPGNERYDEMVIQLEQLDVKNPVAGKTYTYDYEYEVWGLGGMLHTINGCNLETRNVVKIPYTA